MRTIKRKRIFGGKKSIHKKKHKRSLKKFRGGVELNYLQAGADIYNVRGILGSHKTLPLYKKEADYSRLSDIDSPQEPNLFKGSIKHDKGTVILTDYKPLKSIKLGWIYGGHFGNIVIYSSTVEELEKVRTIINEFLFKNNQDIAKTLFVSEINEKVIKIFTKLIEEKLESDITPWVEMDLELDLNEADLVRGIQSSNTIDNIFKGILEKYYVNKIDGISIEQLRMLLNYVDINKIDATVIQQIRSNSDLLDKYKDILRKRNKSFVRDFTKDYILDDIPTTEKWSVKIPSGSNETSGFPDIYKKINALRLKQEIIYKELTDIFNNYKENIYPFNIEYFLCNFLSQEPKSNELINRVIEKFKHKIPMFNNRCYKSISKIMYILQLFNLKKEIYKDENIVRYTKINVIDPLPKKIDVFFNPDASPLTGFRDFMNKNIVNSLIDPVIMARLLSFNICIRATILLSCDHDQNTKELKTLDINKESSLYKNIEEDDLRLVIKSLKIDGKEITDTDLENANTPTNPSSTKLNDFVAVLGNGDTEKSIECKLENPYPDKQDEKNIDLNCKCRIYMKQDTSGNNKTNIMIYLYDKQNKFYQVVIDNLLNKSVTNMDDIYTIIDDKYLEDFYNYLFKEPDGHEHNYYDLIL